MADFDIERLSVPRPAFDTGLKTLQAATGSMRLVGEELARSIPEIGAIRRRLEENGCDEAVVEIDQLRNLIVRLQKQLVAGKAELHETWRTFRRCDPELTPDRPPSRDDMRACSDAVEAFANAAAIAGGKRP